MSKPQKVYWVSGSEKGVFTPDAMDHKYPEIMTFFEKMDVHYLDFSTNDDSRFKVKKVDRERMNPELIEDLSDVA